MYRIAENVCGNNILQFTGKKLVCGFNVCGLILTVHINYMYEKTEKTFKNEQRSKDAAAKKRPNTSGVGKINNYYEDIYIPPNNNTD